MPSMIKLVAIGLRMNGSEMFISVLDQPAAGYQSSMRPRVSGIQIHAMAATKNAAPVTPNARPNPRACAIEPTANGATALATRPMLYVKPCAVARIEVG